MTGLDFWGWVSVLSALLAIASFGHAIVVREKTKRDTVRWLTFVANLVVNAVPYSADAVRRWAEDVKGSGEYRAKVVVGPDGQPHIHFAPAVDSSIGLPHS